MFLLDTNVVSHSWKSKSKQNPVVRDWLDRQTALAIAFPTFLEIQRGILELQGRDPDRAADLISWFAELLTTEYHYPALDARVSQKLAEMYCCRPLKFLWYVNPKHEAKPSQDLFIAAIAIVHGLPLATMDNKDFTAINRHFPLPGVYNPALDTWLVTTDHTHGATGLAEDDGQSSIGPPRARNLPRRSLSSLLR